MKNIKIITCHDVYNYGASLQAFALQSYLKSKGNEVQIIDYKPDYIGFHYKFNWFVHPVSNFKKYTDKSRVVHFVYCLLRYVCSFSSIKRKWAFDNFTNKYLDLTKEYKSNEDMKRNLPLADVYIAGSDQIWNSVTMLNGLDPAFYLQFAPQKTRRISYAASFGASKINESYSDQILSWIKSLDAVSVRESSGVKLLSEEGIISTHVCDPVFIYSAEMWKSALGISSLKEQYVLIYNLTTINEKLLDDAIYTATQKGLKLYSVSPMKIKQADKCFTSVSPAKFVELIFNAQYVFTNSFHGTAFSIISNNQFFTYNYHSNENSLRMRSILEKMDLLSRFNVADIKKGLQQPINYRIVQNSINAAIAESQNWLLSNI